MIDKSTKISKIYDCTLGNRIRPVFIKTVILIAVITSGCGENTDKKPFEGTAKILAKRQVHRESISRNKKKLDSAPAKKQLPPQRKLHSKRVTILSSSDKTILGYGEAYFTSKGKMIHITISDDKK